MVGLPCSAFTLWEGDCSCLTLTCQTFLTPMRGLTISEEGMIEGEGKCGDREDWREENFKIKYKY